MDDLRIIKIDSKTDPQIQTVVDRNLKRIFVNPPRDYDVTDLSNHGYEFKHDPTDPSKLYFVMGRGKCIDDILGFAECHEGARGLSIVDASPFGRLGGECGGYLLKKIGDGWEEEDFEKVSNEELTKAPGYSLYTARGGLLHVNYFHIFLQQRGFGREFMTLLKKQNYELIELSAMYEGLRDFYFKNGFLETGLYDGEMPVFVWNNPGFFQDSK